MLNLDTVRGPHSTGTARVFANNRPNVDVVKGIGTPWDLRAKDADRYYGNNKRDCIEGNVMCLIGHNRWATVGEVNEANAHPFTQGVITGVHNGTLPDHWRKRLEDWEMYGTDSEALYANINQFGVENVIPHIGGAWALTWYDADRDSFNVLRNSERPLYFAWKKNGRVLFFASEYFMIYQAAEKFGIELENDLAYSFTADKHYEFQMPKAIGTFGKNCMSETPLKGYTPPVYSNPRVTYLKGNTATNVVPINDAKASANVFMQQDEDSKEPSPSSFEWWVARKDKYFEFTIDGSLGIDEQRVEYIRGRTTDGVEVRIYAPSPAIAADLSDPNALTYAAKVKKIKALPKKKSFYITMDQATFMVAMYRGNIQIPDPNKELEKEVNKLIGWDDTPDVIIADGRVVDEKQFMRMTDRGCCFCGAVPYDLRDAPHLHWLNAGEFLCEDCANDTSTMQYVSAYTK